MKHTEGNWKADKGFDMNRMRHIYIRSGKFIIAHAVMDASDFVDRSNRIFVAAQQAKQAIAESEK